MKAYKLLVDISTLLAKGRVLCPFNGTLILIATPTEPQYFIGTYYHNPSQLIREGKAVEINLEDESALKPHFYKQIKLALAS